MPRGSTSSRRSNKYPKDVQISGRAYWNNDAVTKLSSEKTYDTLLIEESDVKTIMKTPILLSHAGKDQITGYIEDPNEIIGKINHASVVGQSVYIIGTIFKEYAHLVHDEGYKALSIGYRRRKYVDSNEKTIGSEKTIGEISLCNDPKIKECTVISSTVNNSNGDRNNFSQDFLVGFPIKTMSTEAPPQQQQSTPTLDVKPQVAPQVSQQQPPQTNTGGAPPQPQTQQGGQQNQQQQQQQQMDYPKDEVGAKALIAGLTDDQLREIAFNNYMNQVKKQETDHMEIEQQAESEAMELVSQYTDESNRDPTVIEDLKKNEKVRKLVKDVDKRSKTIIDQHKAEVEQLKRKLEEQSVEMEKFKSGKPQTQDVKAYNNSFDTYKQVFNGGSKAPKLNHSGNNAQIKPLGGGMESYSTQDVMVNNSNDGVIPDDKRPVDSTLYNVKAESYQRYMQFTGMNNLNGFLGDSRSQVQDRLKNRF